MVQVVFIVFAFLNFCEKYY